MTEASQRGFLDFSPIKKDDNNKENDLPVLSLMQFSKAPFVTFGTVKLGSSKSSLLRVENPTEDAFAEVTIDKISSTKGFSADCNRFTIQVRSGTTNLQINEHYCFVLLASVVPFTNGIKSWSCLDVYTYDAAFNFLDLIRALLLQPESSFILTITWTPTEEGGIRELIVFNYGFLKHQAVLLGRAEAPKKKKVFILYWLSHESSY